MQLPTFTLHLGDCLESLRAMPDNSVDSIVTDPPYGLTANKKGGTGVASVNLDSPYGRARIGTGNGAGGFMGHKWDSDVPSVEIWAECLRVLKPGGHLLAFAGTRTQHRMAVRIEDAGFEIRDMIAWIYGSGFPKSMDVSKAIDRAAGAERELTREGQTKAPEDAGKFDSAPSTARERRDAPATEAARQWQGWGTALKPALEPITVARKPLIGTVAANVLEWGTGSLNIDGCRVETTENLNGGAYAKDRQDSTSEWAKSGSLHKTTGQEFVQPVGRWPANLILSDDPEVLTGFPDSNGSGPARTLKRGQRADGDGWGMQNEAGALRDAGTGSAARFFYCAKASKRDRDEGMEGFESKAHKGYAGATISGRTMVDGEWVNTENERQPRANIHPTVKPTDLMAYLVRLVTPPGGVVLDPFMGSGSTGKAAMREGFNFIGCELSPEYLAIAEARIQHELAKRQRPEPPQPDLFAA